MQTVLLKRPQKNETGHSDREKHTLSMDGGVRKGLLGGIFVLLGNSICKGPVAKIAA